MRSDALYAEFAWHLFTNSSFLLSAARRIVCVAAWNPRDSLSFFFRDGRHAHSTALSLRSRTLNCLDPVCCLLRVEVRIISVQKSDKLTLPRSSAKTRVCYDQILQFVWTISSLTSNRRAWNTTNSTDFNNNTHLVTDSLLLVTANKTIGGASECCEQCRIMLA